ncbi:MAG TPA: DUF4190 domain-containing protein [Sedimentisphaerales bacterium]|jgi:hypothetical protein|nr:DUF4190 domain-containing protein [Sedimentisphaerales bacterium]
MENVSNVSSEEELLALRNEGKVTQDEYEELLGSLRRAGEAELRPAAAAQAQSARTSGLAIASIVLAVVLGPFGIVPAVVCGHLALRRIERDPSLTGRGLALAGLIAGYSVLGLTIILSVLILLPMIAYRAAGTSPSAIETTELRWFPLDDLQGLITQSGVSIDKAISSDGNGSLRIDATGPTTVRLFETGDVDIEYARLIYQAKLRTEDVRGQVYLEMWCHFPEEGLFFSKGMMRPLTGTTDWTTVETPFFLKQAQNPDDIKLNLVVGGKGTVWIDDIRLLKGKL